VSPLGCIDIDVLLGPFGAIATPDYGNKNSIVECIFRGDIPCIATVSDKAFRVSPSWAALPPAGRFRVARILHGLDSLTYWPAHRFWHVLKKK
jgi:hypothetical protein